MMENITVKPKFILAHFFLRHLPKYLIYGSIFVYILYLYLLGDGANWRSYKFLMLWCFFYLCFAAFRMIQYQCIRFVIEGDKIKYMHNFLITSKKDVVFKNVKEITMTQGVVQKMFGLGDIHLTTHATVNKPVIQNYSGELKLKNPFNLQNEAGIILFDVQNPQELYEGLEQIYNKTK